MLSFAGPAAGAAADEPFPLRNQLPLHLPFLDQTPRDAHLLEPGQARLAVHLTHSNTLIATDDLVSAFRAAAESGSRMEVSLAALESVAAASPAGIAYISDGETLRAGLDLAVAVGPRFELSVEVPLLLHSSGLFDSSIERYHDFMGFPDGGRPAFVQNRFVAGYVGGGEVVYIDGPPGGVGVGDVVLGARTPLARGEGRRPAVTASVHLKCPTGDPERLEGSGHVDYGASVQISHRIGRSTLHGAYSRNFLGDWSIAPELPIRDSHSLLGGYVFNLSPRNALLGQLLRSRGPFPSRPGSTLGRTTTEIAIGSRHALGTRGQIEWALIEDIQSDFNTPDVGLFAGWTYRFELSPGASGPPLQ